MCKVSPGLCSPFIHSVVSMIMLADIEWPVQTALKRRLILTFIVRIYPKTCFRMVLEIMSLTDCQWNGQSRCISRMVCDFAVYICIKKILSYVLDIANAYTNKVFACVVTFTNIFVCHIYEYISYISVFVHVFKCGCCTDSSLTQHIQKKKKKKKKKIVRTPKVSDAYSVLGDKL